MLRERYRRQIDSLREDLLRLGSMVEHALLRAMQSLETWDTLIVAQILHDDAAIDGAWHAAEEKAVLLMATQQPVASDLRLLAAVVAISGELERIGDYACSIARRTERITRRPALVTPPGDLWEMGRLAQMMLRTSLDAFLYQDPETAYNLGPADDRVDELESRLQHYLLNVARSDPTRLEAVIDMLDIVHALERVADRATNIGERVIYLATNETPTLNP